ncbi:Ig-like domain-containing protein [Paenibacillus oceani]|uniref:Ig-like domain-containing protein n=1 Tax=Paenibacillus oceani TaxID=2772510 RepID=UPI001CC2615A
MDGIRTQTNRPRLTIHAADRYTGVNAASIRLGLDGETVGHTYDEASGTLFYTPPVPLEPDSKHTASVTAADLAGNVSSVRWSFTVGAPLGRTRFREQLDYRLRRLPVDLAQASARADESAPCHRIYARSSGRDFRGRGTFPDRTRLQRPGRYGALVRSDGCVQDQTPRYERSRIQRRSSRLSAQKRSGCRLCHIGRRRQIYAYSAG